MKALILTIKDYAIISFIGIYFLITLSYILYIIGIDIANIDVFCSIETNKVLIALCSVKKNSIFQLILGLFLFFGWFYLIPFIKRYNKIFWKNKP